MLPIMVSIESDKRPCAFDSRPLSFYGRGWGFNVSLGVILGCNCALTEIACSHLRVSYTQPSQNRAYCSLQLLQSSPLRLRSLLPHQNMRQTLFCTLLALTESRESEKTTVASGAFAGMAAEAFHLPFKGAHSLVAHGVYWGAYFAVAQTARASIASCSHEGFFKRTFKDGLAGGLGGAIGSVAAKTLGRRQSVPLAAVLGAVTYITLAEGSAFSLRHR